MNSTSKLLTLAIPTYNREKPLDDQIAWAVKSVEGAWHQVELIICDNASIDNTQQVCEKWRNQLGDNIKIFRNEENVGLVRNCFLSLSRASGKYVWLIGDDDSIDKGAVGRVLDVINKHPDLSLIHINHRCVSGKDGSVIEPKFYNLDSDIFSPKQGVRELSTILESYNTGGLMFITANVLNRVQALSFLESNPPEEKLLLPYPLLLNAGLASTGPFYFVATCLLDCVYYNSSWSNEYEFVAYEGVPQTLVKLKKVGISKNAIKFCLDFQYQYFPTVRDMLYRIRKGYTTKSAIKIWARRWLLKNRLKKEI